MSLPEQNNKQKKHKKLLVNTSYNETTISGKVIKIRCIWTRRRRKTPGVNRNWTKRLCPNSTINASSIIFHSNHPTSTTLGGRGYVSNSLFSPTPWL
ncbi:hypothetical protein CEXT_589781 [Caerostris extrusa]|uniref:Uncharacterized protein n=1 Tax=Caerostris extrusa TaxID=172846 RepID=A0AAV4NXM7_CAEEX|nr:hypothetical protein CEXT_589781 [Caerostris extrusa]